MQWKLVVFDLDGTLIDSATDLVVAVNVTRRAFGLEELPAATVASYVGNGAPVLIRRAMGEGCTDEQLAEALDVFIRYYHDHALDYTVLYPGVRGAIRQLRAAGVQCAVLTNKPIRISESIVEGLGLKGSFLQVYGGNSFATKKPDPEGLLALMAEAGCTPGETLMVGDSWVDIETARNAKCGSCGVTFGLQPETLNDPRPDYVIDAMAELVPIVLGASENELAVAVSGAQSPKDD